MRDAGRGPLEAQLARLEALTPALRAAPAATEVHLPSGVQLAFESGGNAMFLELDQLEHLREADRHSQLERMTPQVPRALRVLEYGVGALESTPETIEAARNGVARVIDDVVGIDYLLVIRVWELEAPGVTAIHLARPGETLEPGTPAAEFTGGHLVGDALLVGVEHGTILGGIPFDVRSSAEVAPQGPHPLLDDLTRNMVRALDEALTPIRNGTVY